MHKLPENIDFNLLINTIVQQISYASNNIVISFESNNYIQIEYAFRFGKKDNIQRRDIVFPINDDLGLLALLDKRVLKAYHDSNRSNLFLEFDGDYFLEILNNEGYESYIIKFEYQERIIL